MSGVARTISANSELEELIFHFIFRLVRTSKFFNMSFTKVALFKSANQARNNVPAPINKPRSSQSILALDSCRTRAPAPPSLSRLASGYSIYVFRCKFSDVYRVAPSTQRRTYYSPVFNRSGGGRFLKRVLGGRSIFGPTTCFCLAGLCVHSSYQRTSFKHSTLTSVRVGPRFRCLLRAYFSMLSCVRQLAD